MTTQTEGPAQPEHVTDRPPEAVEALDAAALGSRDAGGINLVHLRGVLTSPPGPSPSADTDTMWVLQVPSRAGRGGGDRFDCRITDPEIALDCADWAVGAVVEVQGSLRRRFFRAGGTTVSKVEVVVSATTLVEPAGVPVAAAAAAPV